MLPSETLYALADVLMNIKDLCSYVCRYTMMGVRTCSSSVAQMRLKVSSEGSEQMAAMSAEATEGLSDGCMPGRRSSSR